MIATTTEVKNQQIEEALPFVLLETNFNIGKKYRGLVKDCYDLNDELLIISTDREQILDGTVAIPYKGQVLNLLSAWWFEYTEHLIQNHLIVLPDPNVTIAKKCVVFPIDFVVEASKNNPPILKTYIKNQEPITYKQVLNENLMTKADWEYTSKIAMELFNCGSKLVGSRGLLLTKTKYEMGRDLEGNIILLNELHTTNNSIYRFMDDDFISLKEPFDIFEYSKNYIRLFEIITGTEFSFSKKLGPIHDRIKRNIAGFLV